LCQGLIIVLGSSEHFHKWIADTYKHRSQRSEASQLGTPFSVSELTQPWAKCSMRWRCRVRSLCGDL